MWQFYSGNAGYETPYGHWPFFLGIPYGMTVADGKIYAFTGEHSPNSPLYKGEKLFCIDAKTGKEIWHIAGWWLGVVVAEGYITSLNGYDNRVYCFGKGPSKTEVTVQNDVIPLGNSILIKGSLTDISAGTKQHEQAARFPNGVPVVSDASMGTWMEYVYMQKPVPTNVTGVEVTLDAIAPNGTLISVGRTTTDMSGTFSYMWKPPSEGIYKIIATFEGSESYWPSYAETAVGVTEAPTPSATAEQAQVTQSSIEALWQAIQPLITALLILVIIAIVIGVYSIYVIRKLKK